MIRVKRAYDAPEKSDGFRILVDRLWPRGISKDEAKLGLWLKDIAPSDDLRKWFNHDEKRWLQFRKRYARELGSNSDLIKQLRVLETKHKNITLLYAARDTKYNNAVALKEYLEV